MSNNNNLELKSSKKLELKSSQKLNLKAVRLNLTMLKNIRITLIRLGKV